MGTLSHALILTILTISISTNAHLHVSSHSLPYTSTPPASAPASVPAPSHHHNHSRGGGHHKHPKPYTHTPPPQPSKPVTPSPPPPPKVAKPPTYPTPAVPPTKVPTIKPPTTKPANPPVKPPTKPAYPPVKPPTKPAYPPVKPPIPAPVPGIIRKYVAVQGMVYCKKNCTYAGISTLLGASPLPGARVVLRCKNSKNLLRKTARTDKNGYFWLQAPPLITTYGAHKCKVYLARKTKFNGPCTKPAVLNGGSTGAFLYSNNTGPPKPLPTFSLFTLAPFAYEPSKCYKH